MSMGMTCETENEAMVAILILSILVNLFHFHLIALKPAIYRFSRSASLCGTENKAVAAMFS